MTPDFDRPEPETVLEFIGVYDANGGLRGEVAYVAGKLLGRVHCSLCDITHSPVRRKREWDVFVATLPAPFTLVHRNERSADIAEVTGEQVPSVVARTSGDAVVILTPKDLADIGGSVAAFEHALREALTARSLVEGG